MQELSRCCRRKSISLIFFCPVFFVLCVTTAFSQEQRFGLNYLQKHFSFYASEDPLYLWANQIFENVVSGIETIRGTKPKLIVIRGKAPFSVFTLADGYVVVSEQALKFCEAEFNKDVALAFILGHELAHLAKRDLWHLELILENGCVGFSGEHPKEGECKQVQNYYSERFSDSYKLWEIEADRLGVIYSAMAGYDVAKLLASKSNFFENFVRATSSSKGSEQGDLFHPPPEVRLNHSRQEIQKVLEELKFFDLGVLYSLIDDEEEKAIPLFNRFLRTFPSREVLANQGILHLKRALKLRPSHYSWILDVDPESRAHTLDPSVSTRNQPDIELNAQFREHVQQAVHFFEEAIRQDPTYIPARAYLGVAHCLDGKNYTLALGYLDTAIQEATETHLKLMLYNNRALAYWIYSQYLQTQGNQEKAKLFSEDAIQDLKHVIIQSPDELTPYENLRRIYEKQGNQAQAKSIESEISKRSSQKDSSSEGSEESIAGLYTGLPAFTLRSEAALPGFIAEPLHLEGGLMMAYENLEQGVIAYSAGNGDENENQAMIDLFVASSPYAGETSRHIRIGDATDKVKQAYGAPSRRVRSLTREYWIYDSFGIGFQFREGNVYQMFLFSI